MKRQWSRCRPEYTGRQVQYALSLGVIVQERQSEDRFNGEMAERCMCDGVTARRQAISNSVQNGTSGAGEVAGVYKRPR